MKRIGDGLYLGAVIGVVLTALLAWYTFHDDYAKGVAAGVAMEHQRALAHERADNAECAARIARNSSSLRAEYAASYRIWDTNSRALSHDVEVLEHDLERCMGIRRPRR